MPLKKATKQSSITSMGFPLLDTQEVLEDQYITTETLYKTYIRETNDVVKLPTPASNVPVEDEEIVRRR